MQDNGIIWAAGYNSVRSALCWDTNVDGRYGDYVDLPKAIPHFIDNGIKIVDIDAGACHNLAVDVDGKVYSWGSNRNGQCGVYHESMDEYGVYCNLPGLITDLKDYRVNKIACGFNHSYVRTECSRHCIWRHLYGIGINISVVNDDDYDYEYNMNIKKPFRIN